MTNLTLPHGGMARHLEFLAAPWGATTTTRIHLRHVPARFSPGPVVADDTLYVSDRTMVHAVPA
jgi:hypothetical protein